MDKVKHFIVGFVVSLVAGVLYAPAFGLLGAVLSGAWKEIIWDSLLKRGTPEFLDFAATVTGGVVAYGILSVI